MPTVSLVVILAAVSACSTTVPQQEPPLIAAPPPTEFNFTACASTTDSDVAQATSHPTLSLTIADQFGCRWEERAHPGFAVATSWFRGSPLSDEKAAATQSELIPTDLTVEGLPGFQARSADGKTCEAVASTGVDLVAWTVNTGDSATGDACALATTLASASVDRGARSPAEKVPGDSEPNSSYPCGLAPESQVAAASGAQSAHKATRGAICRWTGDAGNADVVFAWFVDGTLQREKTVDTALGDVVTATRIARADAIVARVPGLPDQCSVTAATDSGIVSWWIEIHDNVRHLDPCAGASTLTAYTLNEEP